MNKKEKDERQRIKKRKEDGIIGKKKRDKEKMLNPLTPI